MFCTKFLKDNEFPTTFSFNPYNDNRDESLHVQAYKCLQQGLCMFEFNKRELKRIKKPLRAREWILAQEIFKEQERIEQEGQRDSILVREVKTDVKDSRSKGDNDNGKDDGLFLNINAP